MEAPKRTSERRGSLIILTVTIVVVIIIVVVATCVGAATEGEIRIITLLVLLALLIIIGLCSCLFLEYQRKKALQKRDRSAELWLQQTLAEQRRTTQPSSRPPPGQSVTDSTSWALTAPWKYNTHKPHYSTNSLPPYTPPHSNI